MCAERVYLIPSAKSNPNNNFTDIPSSIPDISDLIFEWTKTLSKKEQRNAESILNKMRKSEIRWNEDGQVIYPNTPEDTPGSHITELMDWILKREIKTKPIDVDLFIRYLQQKNVDTRFNMKFPNNWIRLY
jgi:hypothetical protein